MTNGGQNPSLGEAASLYLADLPPGESGVSQQEVYKFIRWLGRERTFPRIAAAEVDNYAEQLSRSDADCVRKLGLIRTFLFYAKKKGWSKNNLAIHLKARKGKSRSTAVSGRSAPEIISLTRQGYAEMEAELTALQDERPKAIAEMRKAAADKDFKENAPLDAAKERRGWIEGRIMDLEAILKTAVVVDGQQGASLRVGIGDNVVLCEVNSVEELCYMLVSPREADAVRGKISSASPMGRALIGKEQGEMVEIEAPVGKLHYQIQRIEH
jgi:transcription elongation factor GreA